MRPDAPGLLRRLVQDDALGGNARLERAQRPLLTALMASAAIPGLFRPVRLDGHLLVEQAVTISLARHTELERRLLSRQLRLAVIRLNLAHHPHPRQISTEELLATGREARGCQLTGPLVDGRVRPGLIQGSQQAGSPVAG